MIISYREINDNFKLDDEVWACAYKSTSDKEGRSNYSKPVRGRLVAENNKLIREQIQWHQSKIEKLKNEIYV